MSDGNKTFQVSIDLDAEIRKISQDQYLNDVHYVVQLIRHATHHKPSKIVIRNKPDCLHIHQNGDTINPDEWDLLLILCDAKNASDTDVHNAIAQIEHRFGIALLMIFRSFSYIEILNGIERLVIENGKGRLEASSKIVGYTVIVRENSRDRRRELRELKYFCSDCTVPIIYNGKSINRHSEHRDLILTTTASSEKGHGICGIPRSGTMSTLHYRKAGIRYGTRSEIAEDGRIILGDHNSGVTEFEPHFRKSIKNAHTYFLDAAFLLYGHGLEQFEALKMEDKVRIKHLLFGIDDLTQWHHIPVFNSVQRRFRLSVSHITDLTSWFGYVPYSPTEDPSLPSYIPQFDYSDLRFIRTRLDYRVRPISIGTRVMQYDRSENSIDDQNRFLSDASTVEIPEKDIRRFIHALNERSVAYVFEIGTGWHVDEDDSGIRHIEMPRDSQILASYINAWGNNSNIISLVRWKIIASVVTLDDRKKTRLPSKQ